jgi:hypothetical protein
MQLAPENFMDRRFGMLTGKRFFRDGGPKVECLCDCGAVKIVSAYRLNNGDTKSCGCLRSITFNKTFTKHGHTIKGNRTKEYQAWRGMIARCNGNYSQKYYLDRGITVSPEWIDDFDAFLAHIGNAPSDQHSVERIKNDIGYYPGNVVWATSKDQARNRRNGVYVTVDAERILLVIAAERHSIQASIVRRRLARGWSDEAALKTPAPIKNSRGFGKMSRPFPKRRKS